ncbi:AraC family transcriptional regulator [Pedobacter psychrodurus]|uniref:helix-turn-helix domain-containing protein n=1 Tax=Pedobacter psychrodurus TaxID=2530456 RepID=UPI00292D4C8E|nr:AraC family transcriptional regulator [Pedobacter psychrodurus]
MKEELISICKHSGIVHSQPLTSGHITEQFIDEHGICYISSGALSVAEVAQTSVYQAGDTIVFRKNILAKFKKLATADQGFKSITIIFDTDMLRAFSKKVEMEKNTLNKTNDAIVQVKGDLKLLENFFSTLSPYFEESLPQDLMALKKQEALMLLLRQMPQWKNVVFDFGQPGKIDLESFMEQNFRFNVPLTKLAVLTGRSLATFKRDFDKIFHTTPSRWLQKRRLEEAHFLISEKRQRPSDIYHAIGFETIAHFSHSFKQHFGITPSSIH